MVTLTTYLQVPQGVNCLAVDFRFFSEEFPEFVGSSVNDGFVAELDVSDFTADAAQNNAVVAPHNFAFDQAGKVISINTAGFSAADAAGTTYDGATPLLRATTPITSGAHTVFFSVFDQGDPVLDSTVFLDHLRLFNAPAGTCKAGTTDDLVPPDTSITAGPTGTTNDSTPTFSFTSTEAGSTSSAGSMRRRSRRARRRSRRGTGRRGAHVRGAGDRAGGKHRSDAGHSELHGATTTRRRRTRRSRPARRDHERQHADVLVHLDRGGVDLPVPGRCGGVRAVHDSVHHGRLADGAHTFEVRATDAAGNTDPTPATRSFTVDSDAAGHVDHGRPDGTTNDSTPTFSFTSTEAGSTFQCRVDAAVFAPCATPFTTATLTDGAHTFEVRATDAAGNTDASPASRSFTVDTTLPDTTPDTTITTGPSGTINQHVSTFTFTSSEAGSTFQCRVDAGAFAACTTPFTTSSLANGTHTFEVRAIDGAGNVDPTPASRTFTIDTVEPQTTITGGPTGTTSDSTPSFTFISSEAGSTFQCRVDAGAFVACATPFTTAALADGAHTFEVRATRRRGEHRRDARDADVHDRDCTAARGPHLRGQAGDDRRHGGE